MANKKFNILPVTLKQDWNTKIDLFPEANFLQSWEWGEFQQQLGKTVVRYEVRDQNRVCAIFQAVKEEAKRGCYLTLAGGPLLNFNDEELLEFVISQLKAIGRNLQTTFIRFRPQELSSPEVLKKIRNMSCHQAPMHLTADLTLQLDLNQDNEQLLMQMRKNTRSEIKKADRLGIRTEVSRDLADIKPFYELQCELAKRHNFIPFAYQFLYEQFKAFTQSDQVLLISSFEGKKLLAQAFVIFYHNEAVYHYGVSTEDNHKLPGSYACQWRAIQEAKIRGCNRYNLWGIAPENQQQHRFAGVSLFKRGFGGVEVEYVPAHDIPISVWYTAVQVFETIRKWRRRL